MSKPDVNFTIGADGSAFVGSMRKIQDSLNKIGQAFMGLQGIAAGLRTAFSAAMAPLQAYGEIEDVKTQLGIMLNSEEAAERLTAALQSMATNGVVGMQDLVAAARSLARVLPQESIAGWVGRFADIAAASKIPAERLAAMVARLNDMGKAEFTELANAGIPIFEALGQVVGASAEEVVKLSAAGKGCKGDKERVEAISAYNMQQLAELGAQASWTAEQRAAWGLEPSRTPAHVPYEEAKKPFA